MLLQIAWKNIWRNKVRSLVVITAVMLGLWAGAFILSYVFGMIDQRLQDAIGNEISHLQLHHPEYKKDYDPQYYIPGSGDIFRAIKDNEGVKAASGRVLATGMVASAINSAGGKFIGIHPRDENHLTKFQEKIIEGDYLDDSDKNKIIIGKKLAQKLKVKPGSKVVLTFQDIEGTIVAGAFRIKGIFKSYNTALEENNLYVMANDLSQILGSQGEFHEVAVLVEDANQVDAYVAMLQGEYPGLLVENWGTIAPELSLMIESLDQYMVIFLTIILLALSFGIVNTMLMAVLERVREIGMLMAIGMNKLRLFGMISLETIFLVLVAAPCGLLLAYLTIQYLGQNGLDLSGMYEGHAAYGFKPIIYPKLEAFYYARIMYLVIIAALLSSIYPAITALKLDPVKAIRKI